MMRFAERVVARLFALCGKPLRCVEVEVRGEVSSEELRARPAGVSAP